MEGFHKELVGLINKYSRENGSNTPDFILATYMFTCLKAFDDATKSRDKWYSVDLYPGCTDKAKEDKSPLVAPMDKGEVT